MFTNLLPPVDYCVFCISLSYQIIKLSSDLASLSSHAILIPFPPPPAEALIMTGYPINRQTHTQNYENTFTEVCTIFIIINFYFKCYHLSHFHILKCFSNILEIWDNVADKLLNSCMNMCDAIFLVNVGITTERTNLVGQLDTVICIFYDSIMSGDHVDLGLTGDSFTLDLVPHGLDGVATGPYKLHPYVCL